METYIFLLLAMASLQMPACDVGVNPTTVLSYLQVSYNLVLSPEHLHVFKSNQTVSFTCTADVRLTGCQFSWWDFNTGAGPLLDFKTGSESEPDPAHLNPGISFYGYSSSSGRGLWGGRCDISLEVKGFKTWVVACRVRPKNGGWRYAWAELYADEWTPMTHSLTTPRETVVIHGGEAKFMINGYEPLLQCRFNLPSTPEGIIFIEQVESNHSTGRLRYLGAGLQSGECGVTLTNVTEADTGLIKVYIRAPNWKEHIRLMTLIVAPHPTAPTLNVEYTATHLTATCEVKKGHPVVNITWFLGNDIVQEDEVNETQAGPHDEWRWPWMTWAIKQTVTRELKFTDQGKELRCVVSHVSLDHTLQAIHLIPFPECGQRNSSNSDTLIYGRQDATVGEFPWHVGIYEVLPGTDETKQICGGTIITPQVVVTAAQCFWDPFRQMIQAESVYKVASGKHLRAWDDPHPSVQKRDVKAIMLPELFQGGFLNFDSDIAILRLKSPFYINMKTNLVCVDWNNTLKLWHLRDGSVGVVAGWGSHANGVETDSLTYLNLPFVPRETCLNSLSPKQRPLLTPDKFCAGYVNQNTSGCGSDAGGGLVFLQPGTDKYYLRGIASSAFTTLDNRDICYAKHYTAFTRLFLYTTWFKEIIT